MFHYRYIYHIFFIQSTIYGHLGHIHVLTFVKNAAVNIGVHISFQVSGLFSFRKIPRSRTAGLYGIFKLNILKNLYIVFHSGCANLHFYLQCMWAFFSLYPHQHLLFILFLIISILTGVVISHCGFDLHFSDDQQCSASFHVSVGHLCLFFGKISIQMLCLFFNQVLFWILHYMSSLYILHITNGFYNPLSDMLFANIFFHSEGCFLVFLIVSFVMQRLFSLMQSHPFVSLAFGKKPLKLLVKLMSKSILPMFTSRSFMVVGLMFKLLIDFEFIFVCSMRRQSDLILLHVIFPALFIQELNFSLIAYSCLFYHRLISHVSVGLFLALYSVPLIFLLLLFH